ncbi:MAG: L-2-amino-thiazoline-4-carboxylic acid hydrolase, partial [Alphaproteobacteria bacterium]|nr:L-2-amino-thiazoline-4-carboxylic acid hydrolase [Alphaproteobacteria bacterium]
MARISQFDRFRTQMAVLVPLTRALREKLGQEAADALVAEVLDEIARKQAAKQVADGQTMTVAKLQAGMRAFSADDALEYEELSDDDGAYDFDVRRCRYSE